MARRFAALGLAAAFFVCLGMPLGASAVQLGNFDITTTGGGTFPSSGVTFHAGVLTIDTTVPLTLTMGAWAVPPFTHRIQVTANANLTLAGVQIDTLIDESALAIDSGCTVTLTLAAGSHNRFTGDNDCAAICVPELAELHITGTGALTAGRSYGAGIGGNRSGGCGAVTISGGTVTASSISGAGIGGGANGGDGAVTISGGMVTASSDGGAGIGGGISTGGGGGGGAAVLISGGTVTATSTRGAGIGRGAGSGSGGGVAISGGMVTASSLWGAGIGGGMSGGGGTASISGGAVTAFSTMGAGIGGGANGGGGAVAISGGVVSARSRNAQDIGMGSSSAATGTTTIIGGSVFAEPGKVDSPRDAHPSGRNLGRVDITVEDAAGAPLNGATVTAGAYHALTGGNDTTFAGMLSTPPVTTPTQNGIAYLWLPERPTTFTARATGYQPGSVSHTISVLPASVSLARTIALAAEPPPTPVPTIEPKPTAAPPSPSPGPAVPPTGDDGPLGLYLLLLGGAALLAATLLRRRRAV